MENFKKGITDKLENIPNLVLLALVTLLIIVVTTFAMFQPIWGNIPFTIVLPIVVLLSLNLVFFEKLKVSTLIIIRVLILLPIFGLMSGGSFVKIVLPFMAINILEASLVDFKRKKYFNAITGIGLIVTLLLMTSAWWDTYYTNFAYDEAGGVAVVATWMWALAYTFWNWSFVAVEFKPGVAFLHLGILATPIVLGLVYGAEFWMIARAYSLTFGGGVIQIFFKDFFERKFTSPKWEAFVKKAITDKVQLGVMVVNLGLLVIMYLMV